MSTVADPIVTTVIGAAVGAICGAIGGAWGANLALRERVARGERRIDRLEGKVGVTEDGTLTGNGLIGTVAELRDRVDLRNDRQHPGWRQSHPHEEDHSR